LSQPWPDTLILVWPRAEQEYSFAGFVHEVFALPFGKAGIRS